MRVPLPQTITNIDRRLLHEKIQSLRIFMTPTVIDTTVLCRFFPQQYTIDDHSFQFIQHISSYSIYRRHFTSAPNPFVPINACFIIQIYLISNNNQTYDWIQLLKNYTPIKYLILPVKPGLHPLNNAQDLSELYLKKISIY